MAAEDYLPTDYWPDDEDDMADYVHINVKRIKKKTDKAFLLLLENGEEHWIPFSQIADDADDYNEGDRDCSMSITDWIAQQKGIEEE